MNLHQSDLLVNKQKATDASQIAPGVAYEFHRDVLARVRAWRN